MKHVCGVCFTLSVDHEEDCGTQEDRCEHWPPLCCPGCDCGSFEEAHPELEGANA